MTRFKALPLAGCLLWVSLFQRSALSAAAVDLNGMWESDANTPESPRAKVLIFQLRGVIQIFNAGGWHFIKPGDVFVEAPVKAAVQLNTPYQVRLRASKDGSRLDWYSASLLIQDPDHILVANRFRFHRTSTIHVEDFPCEDGNAHNVSRDEAAKRADAYFGIGDFATSVCWDRIGAKEGNSHAQASYAYALFAGRGVKQDLEESKVWAKKAANQRDPYAEQTLAAIYMRMGFGLGLDEARDWSERAKRDDPDKVYLGEQTPYSEHANPQMPSFHRDLPFTYDLAGEWKMTFPPSVKRAPLVVVSLEQKGQSVTMTTDSPNTFYPFNQIMFDGAYREGKIIGEWMDAPAHKTANGYYASTKIEIDIKKPTELVTPAGIHLTRSDELGANQLCDAQKYQNMDEAYAFNYAVRDAQLRNFGNAACWMYVAAAQGHHQAQFELGGFLHLGIGVERDDKQSFLWISRSAGQGNKHAQSLLAHYYEAGIGTGQSAPLAKSWFGKAKDGQPEPELPETTEQQLAGLIQTVVTTVCGNVGAGHDGRVGELTRRGMSESQANRVASDEEGETAYFCRLTGH
jgi:TPR repeat protein